MSTRSSRTTSSPTRAGRRRSAERERGRGRQAASRSSLAESLLRPQVVIALALALAVLVLYGPVQSYYAARRDASAYAAQLIALEARNDELRAEVEHLQTAEGIEEEARRRGYVEPGETAVKVAGLPEEEPDISQITSGIQVEQEVPWYLSVLDFVFGYQPARVAG